MLTRTLICALLLASWGPMTDADRLAAIYVIGRIPGVPEARDFLQSALAQANQERFRAIQGLKAQAGNP